MDKIEEYYFGKIKPRILSVNTYFWHGFYGTAKYRHRKAVEYAREVYEWLCKIFNNVDDVTIEQRENEVYLNSVCVFSISSSRRYVYKRQNVRYIKKVFREHKEKISITSLT